MTLLVYVDHSRSRRVARLSTAMLRQAVLVLLAPVVRAGTGLFTFDVFTTSVCVSHFTVCVDEENVFGAFAVITGLVYVSHSPMG